MATKVVLSVCCICILNYLDVTFGASHWIVTEDGKIQSHGNSIFNLARPYDLVSLLQQEQRAVMLESLKDELLQRKDEIDKNEDKDTGLEQRFYKMDPDCILAGKPLPDFDLYISTVLPLQNKGIRPEEHIDFKPSLNSQVPNCSEVSDLDFSVHAFEHLEGMKDRHNLTGSPELGLKNAITHRHNVDDYGNLIYEALKQNKTSWVLYNMAAFYWRIKGEPYQVIECLRRALHYSPRLQKDVALIRLATVLHRSRYSNEAAIVVHSALEVSKELNVNHFTLGNIYAVLAEYNKSVICFENTLMIQPDFEAAAKRKHAVLCHAKLESALEAQHRSLQRTLNELREYQKKHEYWQQQQEKLITEQESTDTKFEQRFAYEQLKVHQSQTEKGEICHMVIEDGRHILKCEWGSRRKRSVATWQSELLEAARNAGDGKGKTGTFTEDISKPTKPAKYRQRRSVTPEEESKLSHKAKDWPDKATCDAYVQRLPRPGEFPTNYLSPVNKGFDVKVMLGDAQGLKAGMQHPLPWYPPVCISLEELPESNAFYDQLLSVRERSKETHRIADLAMKQILLSHVDGKDVTEEEVGQRILTALKKNLGPRWILYNLAGLYWRVIGNVYQGIECLRRALHYAPEQYQDVPLLNLANILYRWKKEEVEDALTLAKRAIKMNSFEPELHFFMGVLCAEKRNLTGAIWHFEEVLHQDPEHSEGLSMLQNIKCTYKFHYTAQSSAPKEETGSCTKTATAGPCGQRKVESIITCSKRADSNRENCVVDTPVSGCNCGKKCSEGTCVQTCHVSPIVQVDPLLHRNTPVIIGGGGDSCAQGDNNCDVEREVTVLPVSDSSDGDLSLRLDEISEYYRQKGICSGDECKQLFVQCLVPSDTDKEAQFFMKQSFIYYAQETSCYGTSYANPYQLIPAKQQCMTHGHHKPHTRLEVVNGILHQKLIFINSPSELVVRPEDCVIFSDGSKTVGCAREEFKPFLDNPFKPALSFSFKNSDLSDDTNLLEDTILDENSEEYKAFKAQVDALIKDSSALSEEYNAFKAQLDALIEDSSEDYQAFKEKVETIKNGLKDKIAQAQENVKSCQPKQKLKWEPVAYTDEEIIKYNPDPARHARKVPDLAWPTAKMCETEDHAIDFNHCPSTWVSPTTRNILFENHIDLNQPIGPARYEPTCDRKLGNGARVLTLLEGIADPSVLDYSPEDGLKETFQLLSDLAEGDSVGSIGTKIAMALKKAPSDWVVNNLAVLYWRVLGNAEEAINCAMVAYVNSPNNAKNIVLLSLTNILQKGGQKEDAIIAANMALEVDSTNIATHFTLANVFAAKGEYLKAMAFYESTLSLQPNLQPAKYRLLILRCYHKFNSQHLFIGNHFN